jgi:tetratricopeptide (TPR) repeat protein
MLAILLLFFAQARGDLGLKAQRVQEYMAAGRFRDAIPLCEELVKAVPGNALLLTDLVVAQHMTGNNRAAVENLRAAVKLDARSFPARLFWGLSEMSAGHPALAIEPLRKALEIEPANSDAQQALAEALDETGRFEEAAADWRKVTNTNPANARAWYALGRTYVALASGEYAQLLAKVPPDSAYALAVRADALMRREQARRAFLVFREVLAKDPDLVNARAALAGIYRGTGHADWGAMEEAQVASLNCATHPLECDSMAGRYEAVLEATAIHRHPELCIGGLRPTRGWRIGLWRSWNSCRRRRSCIATGPVSTMRRVTARWWSRNCAKRPNSRRAMCRCAAISPWPWAPRRSTAKRFN